MLYAENSGSDTDSRYSLYLNGRHRMAVRRLSNRMLSIFPLYFLTDVSPALRQLYTRG